MLKTDPPPPHSPPRFSSFPQSCGRHSSFDVFVLSTAKQNYYSARNSTWQMALRHLTFRYHGVPVAVTTCCYCRPPPGSTHTFLFWPIFTTFPSSNAALYLLSLHYHKSTFILLLLRVFNTALFRRANLEKLNYWPEVVASLGHWGLHCLTAPTGPTNLFLLITFFFVLYVNLGSLSAWATNNSIFFLQWFFSFSSSKLFRLFPTKNTLGWTMNHHSQCW